MFDLRGTDTFLSVAAGLTLLFLQHCHLMHTIEDVKRVGGKIQTVSHPLYIDSLVTKVIVTHHEMCS